MQNSVMLDEMSSSTPSPTASATQNTSANNSASRRPPRKSTLTQQQKNQKRQRATQDQLSLLEVEFNRHPTPTAAVRERIAQEINMTERSVQIWFQNRYVVGLSLRSIAGFHTGLTCSGAGVQKSSCSLRNLLKPAKTVTLFRNPTATISHTRRSKGSRWHVTS
jgi:hypothetical protein